MQDLAWSGFLKAQRPRAPVTNLLQGDISQAFPNSSTNYGPSIQAYGTMGAILTQTTTGIIININEGS